MFCSGIGAQIMNKRNSRNVRRTQRGSTPIRKKNYDSNKGLGGDRIEGRQAVRELLLAGHRRVREVVLASDLDPSPILDDIIDLADEAKVSIRETPRSKFESMAKTESPQGVLASAAPLHDYDLEDLLALGPEGQLPFLLVLDGITDPGNLGAILRSAECAGVTGIIMPQHRAARITPTAAKSAAGAIEHLRLCSVSGLPKTLTRLTKAGIWSIGFDASGDSPIDEIRVDGSGVALVLGAEGSGLSRLVSERCDSLAFIPMQGVLSSMNVSAAAAVALFNVAGRRQKVRNEPEVGFEPTT